MEGEIAAVGRDAVGMETGLWTHRGREEAEANSL